jgi:ankyrin repeat protein
LQNGQSVNSIVLCILFKELKMNSLNKIVLLSVLSLCTVHVFSMDIFSAAETGNLSRVQELIEQDQSVVNQQDDSGWTPLHWAAYYGHTKIVSMLLGASAKVDLRNKYGRTPLHLAASNGRTATVSMLLDKGADVSQQDEDGETPLHWAAFNGHTAIVSMLLGARADVNQQAANGETPLHWAAYNGNTEIVRMLLDKGADINKQNNDGRTPLHWAARTDNPAIVSMLLGKGADVNQKDGGDGWTPLHWATYHGNPEIVRMLLDAGADQRIVNKQGEDPLAVGLRHGAIEKILRDAMLQRARRQAIASTLARAFQSRLGAGSPAAFLSQDLMAEVTRLAEWSER